MGGDTVVDLDKLDSFVTTLLKTRADPALAPFVGLVGMDSDLRWAINAGYGTLAATELRLAVVRAFGGMDKAPAPLRRKLESLGVI